MKVSRWCFMVTFLYAIGAASYLWIGRNSSTTDYFMPIFAVIILILRCIVELIREKRRDRGIDPAEREPWYLRVWPNAQMALMITIFYAIAAIAPYIFFERIIRFHLVHSGIGFSFLFAILAVVELIKKRRSRER